MKHSILLSQLAICASLLLLGTPAFAGDDDTDHNFGSRVSVGIDKKIVSGLHVFAEEEMRMEEISSVDRFMTSVGASYKVTGFLKVGAQYTAISAWKADDLGDKNWDWRHRGTFDAIGSYKTGYWKFSLRERLQITSKTRDVNEFQQPKTAFELKSRVKVSYELPVRGLEPFVAFEHKLMLNGAKWDGPYTSNDKDELKECTYLGHKDVYTDRLRAQVGVEWQFSRNHAVSLYGIYDYVTDKEIDSNQEGTKLKAPITTINSNHWIVGLGYEFSF